MEYSLYDIILSKIWESSSEGCNVVVYFLNSVECSRWKLLILSESCKIFCPLGVISPCIIIIKMLQSLWLEWVEFKWLKNWYVYVLILSILQCIVFPTVQKRLRALVFIWHTHVDSIGYSVTVGFVSKLADKVSKSLKFAIQRQIVGKLS